MTFLVIILAVSAYWPGGRAGYSAGVVLPLRQLLLELQVEIFEHLDPSDLKTLLVTSKMCRSQVQGILRRRILSGQPNYSFYDSHSRPGRAIVRLSDASHFFYCIALICTPDSPSVNQFYVALLPRNAARVNQALTIFRGARHIDTVELNVEEAATLSNVLLSFVMGYRAVSPAKRFLSAFAQLLLLISSKNCPNLTLRWGQRACATINSTSLTISVSGVGQELFLQQLRSLNVDLLTSAYINMREGGSKTVGDLRSMTQFLCELPVLEDLTVIVDFEDWAPPPDKGMSITTGFPRLRSLTGSPQFVCFVLSSKQGQPFTALSRVHTIHTYMGRHTLKGFNNGCFLQDITLHVSLEGNIPFLSFHSAKLCSPSYRIDTLVVDFSRGTNGPSAMDIAVSDVFPRPGNLV